MANEEVVAFVNKLVAAGKSEAEIRAKTAQRGWSVEDVNAAFALVYLRTSPLGSMPHHTAFTAKPKRGLDWGFLVALLLFVGLIAAFVYFYGGEVFRFFMSPDTANAFWNGVVKLTP